MIFDNFNQTATPPEGAPGLGAAAMTPTGFGLPGAGARRRSLALRTFGLSSVTLFAVALAVSGRADADSIPLPHSYGTATAFAAPGLGQNVPDSGSGVYSAFYSSVGLTSTAAAYASGDNGAADDSSPSVFVQISGGGLFVPGDPVAIANFEYSFEVVAPNAASPITLVPVFVTDHISTTISDGAVFEESGTVQLDTSTSDSNISDICAGSNSGIEPYCFSSYFVDNNHEVGFAQTIGFAPNQIDTVFLNASISFISAPSSFNGTVLIDPTFTIDPAFLQQNPGYSLEFSPGVGDSAPAVPEPATWAMMLVGFGGLGTATRLFRPCSATRHRRLDASNSPSITT